MKALLTGEEIQEALTTMRASEFFPKTIAKAQLKKVIGCLNPYIHSEDGVHLRMALDAWQTLVAESKE